MTPKQLITTLRDQHKQLGECLKKATDMVAAHDDKVVVEIVKELNRFSILLGKHLKLEDESFYPQYLNLKKARGEDIEPTIAFVNQMKDIGKVVTKFVEKYVNEKNISMNSSLFEKELNELINTLNLRIETEEEGIYEIFLAIA